MAHEALADSPPPRMRSSAAIWLAALRPSIASFAALGQEPRLSARRAYAWVFTGGLIGATIQSLAPIEAQLIAGSSLDMLLVALIPVAALIAACYLAAFAWCTQRVARLFRGSGTYQQLAYVFAAFSAPLLIAASIVDSIPPARWLLVVVYVYWMILYVLAVRAVSGISTRRALAAVLVALLMLGVVWLAVVFLAGHWGVLSP